LSRERDEEAIERGGVDTVCYRRRKSVSALERGSGRDRRARREGYLAWHVEEKKGAKFHGGKEEDGQDTERGKGRDKIILPVFGHDLILKALGGLRLGHIKREGQKRANSKRKDSISQTGGGGRSAVP